MRYTDQDGVAGFTVQLIIAFVPAVIAAAPFVIKFTPNVTPPDDVVVNVELIAAVDAPSVAFGPYT